MLGIRGAGVFLRLGGEFWKSCPAVSPSGAGKKDCFKMRERHSGASVLMPGRVAVCQRPGYLVSPAWFY